MRYSHWTTLAASLVFINAACTIDGADDQGRGTREAFAQTPAAAPNLVTVTATDFAFAVPTTVPAGLTTVRLVNQGKELHHAQLVRLDEGHTVEELMRVAGEHGPIPAWARFLGGPNAPAPGGTSEATVDLPAGTYALVCFIPSADGVPHLMKGMVKPLTVVPAQSEAVAPAADVRMTLRDYAFDIAPEITAGRHTIRVENAAAQPHEVVLVRLAPGKTPQDALGWMQAQAGPPPFTLMGGTSFLSTGEANQVTADFEPGEYALFCFVPDAKDGAPHVAHGMVRQITVR
jgi:plastocyanin